MNSATCATIMQSYQPRETNCSRRLKTHVRISTPQSPKWKGGSKHDASNCDHPPHETDAYAVRRSGGNPQPPAIKTRRSANPGSRSGPNFRALNPESEGKTVSDEEKEAIRANWSYPFGCRPVGLCVEKWRDFASASKSHWKPMIEKFIGRSTVREMRHFDRNGNRGYQ